MQFLNKILTPPLLKNRSPVVGTTVVVVSSEALCTLPSYHSCVKIGGLNLFICIL